MIHLGYCTNVFGQFDPDFWGDMWIGLYLDAEAAARADAALFRDSNVFTMNGFPYGGFHAERVKEAVYRPDWTERRRLDYTLTLARLLVAIADASVDEPTISTVPLGWKLWPAQVDAAANLLVECCEALSTLERPIRLCLEPEPGCALETSRQVMSFFEGPLWRAARGREEMVRRHLGVCWDICHSAVAFENPREVAARYRDAGITVGKIQVSNALELPDPRSTAAREQFLSYDEPRYLHQVRDGENGCDDLPQAVEVLSIDRKWRSHFHVPLDRDWFGPLRTTQAELIEALQLAPSLTRQLECETYTWSVLPDPPRSPAELKAAISQELEWARAQLR